MERTIGSTELRQQLTDVLQAVREEQVDYVVETFGRSQAALVNLDAYREYQHFRETHGLPGDFAGSDLAQPVSEQSLTSEGVKRRANGYLTFEVGMALRPGEPNYIPEDRPVWRMSIWLHLRGIGRVAAVGTIDVDATTGEVVPLSLAQITAVQEKANAIARRLSSPAVATG